MANIVLYTGRSKGVVELNGGFCINTGSMKEVRTFQSLNEAFDYIDEHIKELADAFFFSGSASTISHVNTYLELKLEEVEECRTVAH